jgi:hypothetical protein
MQKTAPAFTNSSSAVLSLSVADLEAHGRDWLFDCEYRQHSARTIESRKFLIEKLVWFLREHGHQSCSTSELKQLNLGKWTRYHFGFSSVITAEKP